MKVTEYSDPVSFLEHTRTFLESDQALYGMALGSVERLVKGHRFGEEKPWFVVVEEGKWIRAIALQTPPRPMMLVTAELEAITPLIDALRKAGRVLSGVLGPADTIEFFTRRWAHIHDLDQHLEMHLRLFCIDAVKFPENPPPGRLVLATEEQVPLLETWSDAFIRDCNLPRSERGLSSPVVDRIKAGQLFLWEDASGPKAMAAFIRETPKSYNISWVYTPEEHRGHGYASALTAHASQRALDSGKVFCSLHTDLANPTSNKIYTEIGYRPYCDVHNVGFRPKA